MSIYVRNRACRCPRCKARGVFGGAILITLGILFLLDEYGGPDFDQTWPVLLIVIGILIFLSRTAPTEGHIQPAWVKAILPPPPTPSEPRPGETDPQVKL